MLPETLPIRLDLCRTATTFDRLVDSALPFGQVGPNGSALCQAIAKGRAAGLSEAPRPPKMPTLPLTGFFHPRERQEELAMAEQQRRRLHNLYQELHLEQTFTGRWDCWAGLEGATTGLLPSWALFADLMSQAC